MGKGGAKLMENKRFKGYINKDKRFLKIQKDFQEECEDFCFNIYVRNTLENKRALKYINNIARRFIQINELCQKEGKI